MPNEKLCSKNRFELQKSTEKTKPVKIKTENG